VLLSLACSSSSAGRRFTAVLLLAGLLHIWPRASAKAQYAGWEGRYLNFSLSGTRLFTHDLSLSPLVYEGFLGGLQLGYQDQLGPWQGGIKITGAGGRLRPLAYHEQNQTLTLAGRAYFHFRYDVGPWGPVGVWAGLGQASYWDYHQVAAYANNAVNYTGLFSVGPSLGAQWDFTLPLDKAQPYWGLSTDLFGGVGAQVLRPGYVTPFVAGQIATNEWRWHGQQQHWRARLSLCWLRNNGNQLRLSYVGNFFLIAQPNLVKNASHRLAIEALLRL
jgi:hypothetical protein